MVKTIILVEQSGKKDITIFGRDKEGKRFVKSVAFRPYFYVQDEIGEYKGLCGEKLKKVYVESPKDVPKEREKYEKTWEADIHYPTRYLLDKIDKIEPCKLRICYFDIETDQSIDTQNAPKPITCISCYDNFLNKMITFVWRKDADPRHQEIRKTNSIYYYNNEKEMIKYFFKFIRTTNPDIMTGWNSNWFDFPYIFKRCEVLGMNPDELSPMGYVRYESKYKRVIIKGRIPLDLLTAYKRITRGERPSYSLENISSTELGIGKIKVTPDIWRKDISKLIKYNQRDVELLVNLDNKINIIGFFNSLRIAVGCNFDDTFSMSRLIDIFILRNCESVLPTKPQKVKSEDYKGATVFDVVPGLHKDVVDLDLKSLYPNIMRSFNMSPETLDKWGDLRVGNGISFKSNPKGLFPKLLEKLFELRDDYGKEKAKYEFGTPEYTYYNEQQYAIKDITRAMYGVLAFPGFRLFMPEIAKSITYIGRRIIKWNKDLTEKEGCKVIYGDTDSIFCEVGSLENAKKMKEKLNNSYDDFAKQENIPTHRFRIELDRYFSKIFFGESKKRYVGYVTFANGKKMEPQFNIVGFEYVRSDTPKMIKRLQKEIFKMVLAEKDRDYIFNHINKIKRDLVGGKYNYSDVAIPKGITKSFSQFKTRTCYIKGAEYSNANLGTKFTGPCKVKFLYVKSIPKKPFTEGICFTEEEEVPKGTVINWEKMLPLLVDNKMEKIFSAMGWKYIVGDIMTRSLMDFTK